MPSSYPLSDAYMRWNAAIAKKFFGPHNRDLAVFIDMEDSVLQEISEVIDIRD